MAGRFFGEVGFSEGTVETEPGIWEERIVETQLFGEVVQHVTQIRNGDVINSDISVSSSIRVVADAYANDHISAVRYVKWAGTRWEVTEVVPQSPRLLLRLGGVYNGPTPETP